MLQLCKNCDQWFRFTLLAGNVVGFGSEGRAGCSITLKDGGSNPFPPTSVIVTLCMLPNIKIPTKGAGTYWCANGWVRTYCKVLWVLEKSVYHFLKHIICNSLKGNFHGLFNTTDCCNILLLSLGLFIYFVPKKLRNVTQTICENFFFLG